MYFTLFRNEWNGPIENVHEIGEDKRMGRIIELLDINHVILKFNNCSFVIIDIAIIWS
jgi:hypothetical protein